MAKGEARKLSTVQEIMIISTDYLRRIIAPAARSKEASRCHFCARIVTVSRWKTAFGGSLGEKIHIGGARSVEKSYDWKQPNRLLVVQTGESVNEAKVFSACSTSGLLRESD